MPINLRSSSSFFPYLRYSPQQDRWFVAGETGPEAVEIVGKPIAYDIENGERGWLTIDVGSREWVSVPLTGPMPKKPNPNAKLGFSVLVYASKTLGSPEVHELCANTASHTDFAQALYNQAEENFGKGEVPIVIVTGSRPHKRGKGASRDLEFRISKWVPRPQAFTEALKRRAGETGDESEADDFEDEEPSNGSGAKPDPADNAYAKAKGRTEREHLEEVVTSGKPKHPPVGTVIDDDIPF